MAFDLKKFEPICEIAHGDFGGQSSKPE